MTMKMLLLACVAAVAANELKVEVYDGPKQCGKAPQMFERLGARIIR